jgi:DNA-binding PadR family transcriptional regulator
MTPGGRKQKRFSSEYTILSILEYLYVYARNTPVNKYKIVTNAAGIKQQRPDRVNNIMQILEQNGFIKSIKASSTVTFYQITEQGIEAYQQWIRNYLNFVRNIAKIKEEGL